jgi:hypothetical protein
MPTIRMQAGDVSEHSAVLTERATLMCERCKTFTPHRYHEAVPRASGPIAHVDLKFRCTVRGCAASRTYGTWVGPLRRAMVVVDGAAA